MEHFFSAEYLLIIERVALNLPNLFSGPGLKREVESIPESKRENSVLTWTFHPSQDHDGQTLTCRADNPATKDSMLATVTIEVKCKLTASALDAFSFTQIYVRNEDAVTSNALSGAAGSMSKLAVD